MEQEPLTRKEIIQLLMFFGVLGILLWWFWMPLSGWLTRHDFNPDTVLHVTLFVVGGLIALTIWENKSK
jgi:hypothetical protein